MPTRKQIESSTVAARLKWAREASGLSGRVLARKAGLSLSHVSIIESGKRRTVATSTANALATALGISWVWLLSGEGKAPSEGQIRDAVRAA